MSYKTHSTYRPPQPDAFGYGWPSPTARRWIAAMAALACAEGRHRTETDPETGDEVCRWCGEATS